MDIKTSNMITIGAGFVFILIGIMNIMNATSWWHYVTFICGIIMVGFGIYGYRNNRRF